MATEIKAPVTVADLELMPEDGRRYEVVEGELIVSRAPSLVHQRVSRNVLVLISDYLAAEPIGEVLATPGVIFSEFTGVVPDLVFITKERLSEIASGDRLTGAPDLVIEILSPGPENERRDRVVKRELYGKRGSQEYWILDPEREVVEVYRSQAGKMDLSGSYAGQEKIASGVLPNLGCTAGRLFENVRGTD